MKNHRISEEEVGLIKEAQAGNKLAFGKLYDMYYYYIVNKVSAYIYDEDVAKDIASETFITAYNKLSSFKDYYSFKGWLQKIAYHTAINYIREFDVGLTAKFMDDRLASSNSSEVSESDSDIVDRITIKQIASEFSKLPENHMKICQLFYVNELSIAEISKLLDMRPGTVKSVLSRIRKKLQKSLKT